MRTAFGKLSALAFVLILGILLAAPMRAGQEDRLIPGVRSVRMDPGDTYTLQYTLRADQAQAVSFSSEDSSIAEVSADGLVTAIAPGRTRLRLLARGGASDTVDVEVSGVPVTLFELNTRELVMEKGDVSGLSCRFNQGATDQRVEWMSSNPGIVRVDAAGRVTAVSAGDLCGRHYAQRPFRGGAGEGAGARHGGADRARGSDGGRGSHVPASDALSARGHHG